MSRAKIISLTCLGLLASAGHASAHTSAVGYVFAGTSVSFYFGTYHNTSFTEGQLQFNGPSGSVTVPFSILTHTMPTGLDPATNYFSVSPGGLGPYSLPPGYILTWQGASFTGLSAGSYTF